MASEGAFKQCRRVRRSGGISRRAWLSLVSAVFGSARFAIARASERPDLICKDSHGVAAGGYDVVAYFTDHKAVQGSTQFSAKYNGAEYRFTSAAHRDLFTAKPLVYLPQYGGHCAYAMGHNKMLNGDPQAWLIYKGKLYLTVSRQVLELFQSDVVTAINQADAIWKQLQ